MAEQSAGVARQVEIIRDGANVHMVFTCDDDYAAMMLYDRLGKEMRAGCVRLEVATRERETDLG